MVEVPRADGKICAGETAPAEIVKSTTWNSMLDVVCVREGVTMSVPVSVTVYSPAVVAEQVRVTVTGEAPRVVSAGRVHVRLDGEDGEAVKWIVPV